MASAKQSVVAKLRKQANKGQLAQNVAIAYQLTGGIGEDRIDERVALSGPGKLRVKVEDNLAAKVQGEAISEIDSKDTLELYKLLLDGIENMVPAAEARFVPDTLVGSITFAIGDEQETFYFEADEEECEHRGQPVPAQIKTIMNQFNQIEAKHLSDKTQGRGTLQ